MYIYCTHVYILLRFLVCAGEELDEGGDPPRIWSPFGEYPGTAFTRSMGDVIAEELGVSADPEIIHRKIHPGDRCYSPPHTHLSVFFVSAIPVFTYV